jgi:hypothetical protein
VLTTLAFGDRDPDWQASQIEALVQQGFAYAQPIAETIVEMDKAPLLLDQWLDRCLRACAISIGVL